MTRLELLQHDLYRIARYEVDEPNYLKYNKLLWSNILNMDMEAVEEAIKQLWNANND